MRKQPAHHDEQRTVVGARQTELVLQRLLAGKLVVERVASVRPRDQRVVRTPDGVIDAVEDAREILPALAQHTFEAIAELGRTDLARVRRADGGDLARVDQPGLHERDAPVVLDARRHQSMHRQGQLGEHIRGEDALEREVMDGQYGRDVERGVLRDVERRQRGVPVVRMHHVRPPVLVEFAGGQVCGDPAQQAEAARVVAPVAPVGTDVGAARTPVEERRVDDVGDHAAVRQTPETQRHHGGAEDRSDAHDRPNAEQPVEDSGQARQQDARVDAALAERDGKRRDDIGQAARFDQREDLGGDVKYAHEMKPGRSRQLRG